MTVVVPYDPAWPRRFEEERALLERALAPWLAGGVHHIGSTAIPRIAAKPQIDMMAGVRDLEEARAAFEPLFELGYEETPHRPRTHHFSKPAGGPWTRHLHLTEPGTDLWVERLAFRDALRAEPELVAEYQALKLQMIEEERRGGPEYSAVTKRPFVARVLAQAGIEIPPLSPR
ncbi:MAG: GrpB family protein [Thermoleophilia bacterium]